MCNALGAFNTSSRVLLISILLEEFSVSQAVS